MTDSRSLSVLQKKQLFLSFFLKREYFAPDFNYASSLKIQVNFENQTFKVEVSALRMSLIIIIDIQ